MDQDRAEALISGRVQGVSFRYFTREQARKLGLTGWVKNLADGRVQAVFEGPTEKVEQMIEWCRQGPPAARVDDVEVQRSSAKGEFDHFRIAF
jgi:acylphosphatase